MTQEQQDEKNMGKARKLHGERQLGAIMIVDWRNSKQRKLLLARVRRLAAKVDASRVDSSYNRIAVMFVDSIAVRENIEIKFKNEL